MDGFTPGQSARGGGGGDCCEMGGGACESCALWWEHYYSNHMSDDQKHFLVMASGDFRHNMVKKKQFFPNFMTVTLFSVVETLISFNVTSLGALELGDYLDWTSPWLCHQ